MTGFPPEVQRGISLALEAERRGFITTEKLNELLEYWDKDGQLYPAPAREVLTKLGGISADQLRELLGLGPAGFQPRELTQRLLLLEPLGEGGMGTVYKAQDRVLRRTVAVKLIRKDRLASQQALQRFEREAMVMARVAHPACIPVYDANVVDGQPYLVMKYAPGASLRAEVANYPQGVDPRRVARWGQRLAEGLQACHEVGVVHRDVKPGNVLLDEQDQPLLTDFGVALDGEAATKLTLASNPVGTLAYMPPEQAAGEPADPRSDVYSLGATLYEALTGVLPFTTDQPMVLFRLIAEEPPRTLRALRPTLSEDLERVVLKCLEKRRDDRYPTAQAVALDLARWLAGEPVSARPINWARRTAQRAWRARWTLGPIGAALLTLIMGSVLWARLSLRAARREAAARIEKARAAPDAAGEVELIRLAVDADLTIAGSAAEALRVVRASRHLSAAEANFQRWKGLIERERAIALRIGELTARMRGPERVSESPDKQERLRLERERGRIPGFQQEVLAALERELAAAGAEKTAAVRIEDLRAELYLALADGSLDRDPEQAEALYQTAAQADARGSGRLGGRLLPSSVSIAGPEGGRFRVWRYSFRESEGRPIPQEIASGSVPGRAEASAGEFLVEVVAAGRFPARDTLLLRRGEAREVRLEGARLAEAGPLADALVYLSPGPVRSLDPYSPEGGAVERGALILQHEVTREMWRGLWIEAGKRRYLPQALPREAESLSGPAAVQLPVSGIPAVEAVDWCEWLSQDLSLAGISTSARLPTRQELCRAIRGELSWVFPWGRQFDPSFAACGQSTGGRLARIADFAIDCSPFQLRGLAGNVSELTADTADEACVVVGGSVSDDEAPLRELLFRGGGIVANVRDPKVGFRFALGGPTRAPLVPDPGVDWGSLARERARVGDWGAALPAARDHIALAPGDPKRWLERSRIRFQAGDTWGARFDAIQATILDPLSVQAWAQVGSVELFRGQWWRAVENCTRALELDPRLRSAYWNRAHGYYELGRWDEAVADTEAWIQTATDPKDRVMGQNYLFDVLSQRATAEAAKVLRREQRER